MIVFACACFCTLVMHDMKETKKEGEEEIFSVMPMQAQNNWNPFPLSKKLLIH